MDDAYPRKPLLWRGWTASVVQDGAASAPPRLFKGPHLAHDFARRLYACETLGQPATRPQGDEGTEPYTLQWFLDIENQRHGRQGRWIPRLLEFSKHAGETLLGLGNGLGTDWVQYARHGASVVVCSPSADRLALVRRNFELRGLGGRFLHASPTNLPLESASIDVVCLTELLPDVSDPDGVVQEIYRVLKPGGKVLAVVPAKYDVDFWVTVFFPWQRWFGGGPATPEPGSRYSARRLRRLFHPFVEHRVHRRQLRRSEVPHAWRWVPRPLLERLLGRLLVLKAFKPLSAAISLQAAA